MSRSCAKASACRLQAFFVVWPSSGDPRDTSVVAEAVDVPCPGPLHFHHTADYIYDFCLPNPDVGISILVSDVEHTSVHFDLCDRKFVLRLFGVSAHVSAPYAIDGNTLVFYTCLFRQMARLLLKRFLF